MKKRILIAIVILAVVLGIVFGFNYLKPEENITKEENIVKDTTTIETNIDEVLSGSAEGEALLEQGFEEAPEDLLSRAVRGAKEDNFKIGEKQSQIVYYSQIDSRWKNIMYSNHGDKSQTIGTSGCGPTSAAMVVTGIVGTVYPDQLAELYVNNGYRSYNSGTYLSAFQFTADYFGMEFVRARSLTEAIDKLKADHYVIVSCGKGLFTSGGHFIVLWKYEDTNGNNVIDDSDILHVYDPYLYAGKFDTSARKGKVTLNGNDAILTVYNFRNYANSGAWFCYKHDTIEPTPTPTPTPTPVPTPTPTPEPTPTPTEVTYVVQRGDSLSKIGKQFGVDWHLIAEVNNIPGPNYIIYTGQVLIIPTNTPEPTPTPTPDIPSTVGQTRKLKENTNLYANPDLTGTCWNYLKGTSVTILENVNSNVDYVLVPKTGRRAYISTSEYTTSNSSTPTNSTVGQTKVFKQNTNIYANSNLTGTCWNYLKGTSVKILENTSNTVDYIQVPKTGRKGYVSTSVYK